MAKIILRKLKNSFKKDDVSRLLDKLLRLHCAKHC